MIIFKYITMLLTIINKNYHSTINTFFKLKNNHFTHEPIKMISISPGGFKGFYLLGTLNYIKENYDLSNYIFSGASAGAWCSLIMCMKKPFILNEFIDKNITTPNTILEIENNIKKKLLISYTEFDFDLYKLYVGVTIIKKFQSQTIIYSNFDNLEDAIDCCIASSHIPFITGNFLNKYKNKMTFDGGFSYYPYFQNITPVLHVHPNMWNNKKKMFYDTTLFSKNKYDFIDLYNRGYEDAKINKKILNELFL